MAREWKVVRIKVVEVSFAVAITEIARALNIEYSSVSNILPKSTKSELSSQAICYIDKKETHVQICLYNTWLHSTVKTDSVGHKRLETLESKQRLWDLTESRIQYKQLSYFLLEDKATRPRVWHWNCPERYIMQAWRSNRYLRLLNLYPMRKTRSYCSIPVASCLRLYEILSISVWIVGFRGKISQ